MQMFHRLNLNRTSSIYEATNVKLLDTAFFLGLIDREKVKKTEKNLRKY